MLGADGIHHMLGVDGVHHMLAAIMFRMKEDLKHLKFCTCFFLWRESTQGLQLREQEQFFLIMFLHFFGRFSLSDTAAVPH